MNEFTRHINRILTFLLSLLGFSSCFPVMEYGCPTASFRIFGTVKDEKMNPLPNVQIESKSYGYGIRNKDLSELDFPMRTQSDEDGKYEIMELVSCDYEHREFLLRMTEKFSIPQIFRELTT